MYVYIVDSYVQDKKYSKELFAIQSRLQDLGLSGRFEKLTILKNITEVVKDAERKEVHTIVAIGNDHTLNAIIANLSKDSINIGIIPMGSQNNEIAHALRIPYGERACMTLSKRIVKKLDLGKINGRFFFSSLVIPGSQDLKIECDSSYLISTSRVQNIAIVNFSDSINCGNPQDGKIEAVLSEENNSSIFSLFSKRETTQSIFPVKKLTIKSTGASIPVYCEGNVMVKTPAIVEVAPKKLKMIVGA